MRNAYERDIIKAILESDYKTIMVFKSKLMNSQISFIDVMAVEYNKKIIFGSIKEILFNENINENILVIR
ncbi:hypothetical protein GKZ28_14345 [Clostridium chromiireducens]|uniref:Uncharacterized protein n=1 Tax=Clostridium chromiireducens TaxID=225345 RepID=A0A964RMY9_9CLOT|nr:hypothetical protein [Clostridium chromiireducens]MVX64874.1 hypothetical protein [Clostridium chromiireducens]